MAAAAGAALQIGGAATSIAGAAQGKKGGGKTPSLEGRSLSEHLLNRGLYDVLNTERAVIDDAIAQGNFLQPEMYRALGLEPIYDTTEDPGVADLADQVNSLRDRVNARADIKTRLNAVKDDDTLSPKEKREQARKLKKELKKATPKHANRLRKELARAESTLERAQVVGRRVIGVKPIGEFDPSGSAGGAFREALDLQSQSLVRALKGEEPIDPTLKSAFEERERTLHEQLRRQFGTDFIANPAARQVMSNFDREKAEAFVQFNREQIESMSALSERRAAALSDLTGSRLTQLQAPVAAALGRATGLGKYLGDALSVIQDQRAERELKYRASVGDFNARAYNTKAKSEGTKGIGEGISSIGGAIGGAGGMGGSAGAAKGY